MCTFMGPLECKGNNQMEFGFLGVQVEFGCVMLGVGFMIYKFRVWGSG